MLFHPYDGRHRRFSLDRSYTFDQLQSLTKRDKGYGEMMQVSGDGITPDGYHTLVGLARDTRVLVRVWDYHGSALAKVLGIPMRKIANDNMVSSIEAQVDCVTESEIARIIRWVYQEMREEVAWMQCAGYTPIGVSQHYKDTTRGRVGILRLGGCVVMILNTGGIDWNAVREWQIAGDIRDCVSLWEAELCGSTPLERGTSKAAMSRYLTMREGSARIMVNNGVL